MILQNARWRPNQLTEKRKTIQQTPTDWNANYVYWAKSKDERRRNDD